MSKIKFTINNDIAMLCGDLIRQTVPSLSTKQIRQFLTQQKAVMNLADVHKIDTAGLAWLLSQVELAQANSCQLTFMYLSPSLIKLAELSSVDSFLPITPTS